METFTLEYVLCNLCGADDSELLFEAVDNQFHLPGRFKVVRCRRCGLVYTNPRPTQESIGSYYPSDEYYAYQPSGKLRKRQRQLKALAMAAQPGYDRKTELIKRLIGRMLGLIILNYMDIVPSFIDGGKILDVGCGNGDLIAWMREYGWQTFGVDISPAACEVARKQGLTVFCGNMREACYPSQFIDVITMNHVLEHVHDPLGVLRECSRILKYGGLLIVDVPNIESIDAIMYGASWSALQVPTHLFHYNFDTLSALLSLAGFRIDKYKFKPAFPPLYRDRNSIKYFIENNGRIGFSTLMRLRTMEYIGKPIGYLLAKDRDRKFSINITAYATKT